MPKLRLCRLVVLALTAFGSFLHAQKSEYSLKVDVRLVPVDVAVFDSNGRSIGNLSRDSFSVYEDGTQQEIRSFSPVTASYNTLLLFDCSTSTRAQWSLMRGATARFLQHIRAQDRVAVALFGGSVKLLSGWTEQSKAEIDFTNQPDACKGTDLYRSLRWGLDKLREVQGRKGMLLLTDGDHDDMPRKVVTVRGQSQTVPVDPIEDAAFQQILGAITKSDVRIYIIAVNTDLNPSRDLTTASLLDRLPMRARLQQVADVSGGRIMYPRNPEEALPLYDEISRDLGTTYSLSYTPTKPASEGDYRRIEVRVRGQYLRIRQSRDGYFAN